jgi:hypothetical protein
MVTDKTIEKCHARAIGSFQQQERTAGGYFEI